MNEKVLAERLAFVKGLKEDIAMNQRVLKMARGTPYYDGIKQVNDEMIKRLDEFDVYQQKNVYRCWRCKEEYCVCEDLN